jgi:hypothetical protein
MTDIVERLRWSFASIDYEAADEIERLRDKLAWWNEQSHEMLDAVEKAEAERDRLRAALHRISLGSQNSGTAKEDLGREARAALGEDRT